MITSPSLMGSSDEDPQTTPPSGLVPRAPSSVPVPVPQGYLDLLARRAAEAAEDITTSPSTGGDARTSPQGRGPVVDDIDDEAMQENMNILAEYGQEQRDRRTRERREREGCEDEE